MPRYFFHIDDGTLAPDYEGTELADLADARSAAVALAGALLKDFDGEFWSNGQHWTLHVTDEERRLLFSLHLGAETPSGEITFLPAPDGRRQQ
jgi:hypothetical protein